MEDAAMADTETPETPADDVTPPAAPETPTDAPEATGDGELGAGGKKALDAEREARKAAEKKLREYEDKEKTALQLANERAAEAEKERDAERFGRMRDKVANAKGVPSSSLTGTTEEELTASADELIAWRDQNKPPPPPKRDKVPAPGAGGLKSGASGNGGSTTDPKERAAEAMRRLRAGG
jgi:hypothetical protein